MLFEFYDIYNLVVITLQIKISQNLRNLTAPIILVIVLEYYSIHAHCPTLQAEKDFVDLLKETPDIDIYSQWDDVIPKIESEPRYKALDDDSFRKRLFFECKMDEVSINTQIETYIE